MKQAHLIHQAIPPTRPVTRAQHAQFTLPPSPSSTDSSDTDSSAETNSTTDFDHYGVTAATAARRNVLFGKFKRKNRISDKQTSVKTVLKWIQKRKWSPTTKLSHFATLIKMLQLNNVFISGDIGGAIRQLKSDAIRHTPERVQPITLIHLLKISYKTDPHHRALLHLSWAFGARLTSITALTRQQLHFQQTTDRFSTVTATFRTGKTILSTGAYSITALLPTETANWILSRPARIFDRPIQEYYNTLRRILRPYKIRSIRRGALQHLAKQGIKPELIMLISRHKTIASLYAYLDDGVHATWETRQTIPLTASLWGINIESQ